MGRCRWSWIWLSCLEGSEARRSEAGEGGIRIVYDVMTALRKSVSSLFGWFGEDVVAAVRGASG
jgi:hypothetical protein